MFNKVVLAILPLCCSACSVFMAATPSEQPDLSVLERGTSRAAVEASLGRPILTRRDRGIDHVTYQFFTNDRENYDRAAVYAVLDGLTLGLAELVTFPAEALQGDKHTVVVTYDRFDTIINVEMTKMEAPLPPPERLIGMEEQLES